MGIFIGGVVLDGFEVEARIGFGGRQRLAVHKLPGGSRIIDVMGPDNDAIAWHGILSGNDAAARARALDSLRVAGTAVALSWDVFSALVVVSDLKLEFRNSWWIPYQIACTVAIGTQVAQAGAIAPDFIASILGDFDLAGGDDDGGASLAPLIAPALASVLASGLTSDGTVVGSQTYAAGMTALAGAKAAIQTAIAGAEGGMSAADVPSLVSAAGSLASLTAAAGYIGRAAANFADATF